MLDKMKELSAQAVNKTNEALGTLTSSVNTGIDTLNEKAVRTSTAQMYRMLEIALEELRDRPLAQWPLTLTSTVNVGLASMELQVHLNQGQTIPATETASAPHTPPNETQSNEILPNQ